MQKKSTYAEKLKDPRWQKKRLEILQRDEWACQKCFDSESTLVVHHRLYFPNAEPWDYPDDLLITLCENCHEEETINLHNVCNSLLEVLQKKFLSEDISEIAIGSHGLELQHSHEIVASVWGWALSEPDIQRELIKSYWEHLKKINKEKYV